METVSCLKCLLTTENGVKIDDNGTCSVCKDFEQERQRRVYHKTFMQNETKSRNDFRVKLEQIKSTGYGIRSDVNEKQFGVY